MSGPNSSASERVQRLAVLISGASSGIGAAAARLLTERGFRVFGTSRDPAQRRGRPRHVEWLTMDVRDDASVRDAVARAVERGGGLDALVCNAGYGIFGSVEEVPLDAARAQLETNWFGTLRLLREALPALRLRRGRVVLVGSLAGRAPIPFQAHYSASKAATESLAYALHNELHASGVRVSLVEPGDIRTAFNDATDFDLVPDSHYGERIARCRAVIERSLDAAPGPELVARAIHRALTARRPRVRYAVGPDSLLVPLARRLLPDRVGLRLIRHHFRV